ncbi:MAG TPA: methyltransferase domain-containing protein [Acidilobales archaeon]|nr:methyltransferase domain-containing protein [Acidilobales archaeon]
MVESRGVVVDVGCGVGSLIIKLLGKVRVHAVGLDISLAMLELGK